jgi:hypothetical protein
VQLATTKFSIAALAFAVCSFTSTAANASFLATVLEVGSSGVITGTGTIDILSLGNPLSGRATGIAGIAPNRAELGAGPTLAPVLIYQASITGPDHFGTGMNGIGIGTGDFVALQDNIDELVLPRSHVSNALLTDTNTFVNSTFASLGLTEGTYLYTFGAWDDTDTFTIRIGPADATSTVPEPASIALPFAGVGVSLAVARRRRRKA